MAQPLTECPAATTPTTPTTLGWHFTAGNRLRDGQPVPPVGEWLVHEGPVKICASGLHFSERVTGAIRYAPGATLHRVEVRDVVDNDPLTKGVARKRRVVRTYHENAMFPVLVRFSWSCAWRAQESAAWAAWAARAADAASDAAWAAAWAADAASDASDAASAAARAARAADAASDAACAADAADAAARAARAAWAASDVASDAASAAARAARAADAARAAAWAADAASDAARAARDAERAFHEELLLAGIGTLTGTIP